MICLSRVMSMSWERSTVRGGCGFFVFVNCWPRLLSILVFFFCRFCVLVMIFCSRRTWKWCFCFSVENSVAPMLFFCFVLSISNALHGFRPIKLTLICVFCNKWRWFREFSDCPHSCDFLTFFKSFWFSARHFEVGHTIGRSSELVFGYVNIYSCYCVWSE